jgi:hypothetical protein
MSAAIRFVADDGAHVIHSTEFDLHGEGKDWDSAIDSFWGAATDLFEYITELATTGRAVDHERAVAAALGPRIIDSLEKYAERLSAQIAALQSRKPSLLAALSLRRQEVVVAQREDTWDPDRRTHESSDLALPA